MKLSPRLHIFFLIFLGSGLLVTPCSSASAQAVTKTVVQPSGDWHAVQSLSAETRVRVFVISSNNKKKKTTCLVDSVTEDHLACSLKQGGSQVSFTKEQVTEVQLLHSSRGASIGGGAAVFAGIGAASGALIGLAVNSSDKGNILHESSSAKPVGIGAGLGAGIGAISGALIGSSKNWFASSTVVYQRP